MMVTLVENGARKVSRNKEERREKTYHIISGRIFETYTIHTIHTIHTYIHTIHTIYTIFETY